MGDTPHYQQWNEAQAREIIDTHIDSPGGLMPMLTDMLEVFGHVDRSIIPTLAEALNLSRAEVHGVVSFYHDFRATAPGRHVIRLCRAEACQSMQADALIDHAKRKLGVEWHGTSADGAVTLEPVYCLGNCACAPAMMVDGDSHGRVTPALFDEIVEDLA